MGRAIITSEGPGCRETVVHGHNGFMVPAKDAAALAEAMERFIRQPELIDANQRALKAGYNRGSTMELFQGRYEVPAFEEAPKGLYRNILGNQALGLGLITGAKLAELTPFLASYPITPASDILHQLSGYKHYGVVTMQMEDEIASIAAIIASSFSTLRPTT